MNKLDYSVFSSIYIYYYLIHQKKENFQKLTASSGGWSSIYGGGYDTYNLGGLNYGYCTDLGLDGRIAEAW